jgi:hypothetical protein
MTVKNRVAIEKENAYDIPSLSVCYDIWTTCTNENILGSNLRFFTKKFTLVQVACIMRKSSISHRAELNAVSLQHHCFERFGIDIDDVANYMTCYSASAAH